jgi:hypothetical protein
VEKRLNYNFGVFTKLKGYRVTTFQEQAGRKIKPINLINLALGMLLNLRDLFLFLLLLSQLSLAPLIASLHIGKLPLSLETLYSPQSFS